MVNVQYPAHLGCHCRCDEGAGFLCRHASTSGVESIQSEHAAQRSTKVAAEMNRIQMSVPLVPVLSSDPACCHVFTLLSYPAPPAASAAYGQPPYSSVASQAPPPTQHLANQMSAMNLGSYGQFQC